jgi:hypothetical protein
LILSLLSARLKAQPHHENIPFPLASPDVYILTENFSFSPVLLQKLKNELLVAKAFIGKVSQAKADLFQSGKEG